MVAGDLEVPSFPKIPAASNRTMGLPLPWDQSGSGISKSCYSNILTEMCVSARSSIDYKIQRKDQAITLLGFSLLQCYRMFTPEFLLLKQGRTGLKQGDLKI